MMDDLPYRYLVRISVKTLGALDELLHTCMHTEGLLIADLEESQTYKNAKRKRAALGDV